MNDIKPKLMGGIGEINFGKQYRQGNRIYDAAAIAMCVLAQPEHWRLQLLISYQKKQPGEKA